MLVTSVIAKKRDGGRLSNDEIRFLINGYVAGQVADYQMSAFAMATLLRGMDAQEIAYLTHAMLDSGQRLPRLDNEPPRVDKHSTGGLGDKVSLILAPLLACHDVHVPMISGRGLGLSGGTLDKLEAIPGFQIQLSPERREQQLRELGCFIVGASENIAPADRRLYALRDVTATVESVALITASILSKKLAASLDALIMDVKVGDAAFMKTTEDAQRLAQSIVNTGALSGLPTRALLTDMDQPLGVAVGNAIEVNESLLTLANEGPAEVRELTILLCAELLQLCGRYPTVAVACQALEQSLASGQARERFEAMVRAQGGSLNGPLPLAPRFVVTAPRAGYVQQVDCDALGTYAVELGGGRRVTTDKIDPSVGLEIHVRIGDRVERDQPLLTCYAHSSSADEVNELARAIELIDEPVPARPLIIGHVAPPQVSPQTASMPSVEKTP